MGRDVRYGRGGAPGRIGFIAIGVGGSSTSLTADATQTMLREGANPFSQSWSEDARMDQAAERGFAVGDDERICRPPRTVAKP